MNEAPQRSSSSSSPASRLDRLEQLWRQDPLSRLFPALAEEYRAAGRFAEGAQVCREGLEVYPGFAAARVTLGRILLEMGAEAEAERELETALYQSPENLLGLRLLARLFGDRGDGERARPLLRRLLELSPADGEALRLERALAPAEDAAGTPAVAESAGEAAVELGTDAGEATAGAAVEPEVLAAAEARELAAGAGAEAAAEPVESGPPKEYLTPTMAELYLEQGLPERALAVYRHLLDVDPENREIAGRLALLASGLEKGEETGPSRPGEPPAAGVGPEGVSAPGEAPPGEPAAEEGEMESGLLRLKAQALGNWLEAARLEEAVEPAAAPLEAIREPVNSLPPAVARVHERARSKVAALGRWLAAAQRLD